MKLHPEEVMEGPSKESIDNFISSREETIKNAKKEVMASLKEKINQLRKESADTEEEADMNELETLSSINMFLKKFPRTNLVTMALLHKKSVAKSLASDNPSIKLQAVRQFASHEDIKAMVQEFRKEHSDWKEAKQILKSVTKEENNNLEVEAESSKKKKHKLPENSDKDDDSPPAKKGKLSEEASPNGEVSPTENNVENVGKKEKKKKKKKKNKQNKTLNENGNKTVSNSSSTDDEKGNDSEEVEDQTNLETSTAPEEEAEFKADNKPRKMLNFVTNMGSKRLVFSDDEGVGSTNGIDSDPAPFFTPGNINERGRGRGRGRDDRGRDWDRGRRDNRKLDRNLRGKDGRLPPWLLRNIDRGSCNLIEVSDDWKNKVKTTPEKGADGEPKESLLRPAWLTNPEAYTPPPMPEFNFPRSRRGGWAGGKGGSRGGRNGFGRFNRSGSPDSANMIPLESDFTEKVKSPSKEEKSDDSQNSLLKPTYIANPEANTNGNAFDKFSPKSRGGGRGGFKRGRGK